MFPFKISEGAKGEPEVVTVSAVNTNVSVSFIKTYTHGNGINSEVFELYDAEGTLITTVTSDEEGYVYDENVAPGKFHLIEAVAPKGYVLDKTPHNFTVVATNEGKPDLIELKVINKAVKVLPPIAVNTSRMVVIGLFLNVLGIVIIALRNKKRKEQF